MSNNNSPNRSKRADTSRSSRGNTPRTRNTSRTTAASVTRSPLYIDDAQLSAMVSNLETFGHSYGQFSPQQRSLERYGTGRVPYMPATSTPGSYGLLPSQHESFGSQIDFNLSWMPKDVSLSELAEQSRTPTRQGKLDFNISSADAKFLLKDTSLTSDSGNAEIAEQRKESLIEWFDRSVEKELSKRRDPDKSYKKKSAESPVKRSMSPPKTPVLEKMSHASGGCIEIVEQLLCQPDTELTEAVEKLAEAEAMCIFAGAVEAAEEAARAAPPERAEEAAAAGARGYQAEVTNIVKQTVPGEHPIEVVGYIGITKPKYPKKS